MIVELCLHLRLSLLSFQSAIEHLRRTELLIYTKNLTLNKLHNMFEGLFKANNTCISNLVYIDNMNQRSSG